MSTKVKTLVKGQQVNQVNLGKFKHSEK